jgi:hypothetical protein
MAKVTLILPLILTAVLTACTPGQDLPEDEALESFIEKTSRCAYLERAYSHQSDLLKSELAEITFPPDWTEKVDSLLAEYGADAGFWFEVYHRISEQSRR